MICRSGSRGKQACEKLLSAGYANVVNVEGGTQAWDQAGLPVVRGQQAMSLERQVRIAAGTLVVLGSASALRQPLLDRAGGFRGCGTGVRRNHRHVRYGNAAGADAVEQGSAKDGTQRRTRRLEIHDRNTEVLPRLIGSNWFRRVDGSAA